MSELLQGVLISGIFLLIGIIATISGQEYSAWRNHTRRIEYLREEIFFKKKLEYFEGVLEEIENKQAIMIKKINELEKKKLAPIQEKDKKIIALKSSLLYVYSKDLKVHSRLIELNEIWISFRNKVSDFTKNPKNNTLTIKNLDEIFNKFLSSCAELQSEMRKELKK